RPPLTLPFFPYTTLFRSERFWSETSLGQGKIPAQVLFVSGSFAVLIGLSSRRIATGTDTWQLDTGGQTFGGSTDQLKVTSDLSQDRKSTRLHSSHVKVSY